MVKPVTPVEAETPSSFPEVADAGVRALLQRVLNNVVQHPTEDKYRSLNTAGAAFAKLKDDTAAQALLRAVGFEPREARLVLDAGALDLARLTAALGALQRQDEQADPTAVAVLPALRVPEARDLIYRRGLNAPTLAACRLTDPEARKSGACDACKSPQLMVDDYAICWRCHGYFCLCCVLGLSSPTQVNVRKIGADLAQHGHWARCPECDAAFGAPQIPLVIGATIGAQVSGSADLSNLDDNAGPLLFLDIDFVKKQAAFAETTGDTLGAIEYYTRAITVCNYIRSRLPHGFSAAFCKLFHDLHLARALLEGRSDLVAQLESFIADPVPHLTVDPPVRRFLTAFLSVPQLRRLDPGTDFRMVQDSRLLRQPHMTKSIGTFMTFPFADAAYTRLGGVRQGLVVTLADVQSVPRPMYASVRQFVREFPTADAAVQYFATFADEALELTSIINLPTGPIQHGELTPPAALQPSGDGRVSACRLSLSAGMVRDQRALCNVNYVFASGVFACKLYLSYVCEINPVLPARAQLQDFERLCKDMALQAMQTVLDRMTSSS